MSDKNNKGTGKNILNETDFAILPGTDPIDALTDANKSLRRKIFDLYTIFEISRHLNSMLSVDSLLDATLFTCIGQMAVPGAALMVNSDIPGQLPKYQSKGIVLSEDAGKGFALDGPLMKYLRKAGKPTLKKDLLQQIPKENPDYNRLKSIEAELLLPLAAKGRSLGILFIQSKLSGDSFHEDDYEFVSILVNQLSVAIDNASLYEREKVALAELQSTQKKLIESERLAALGHLSASIAHEVNNPLGIIKNYLTIIDKQTQGEDDIRKNLTIVIEEVNRIADIVKQLLDFYRPAIEEFGEVKLCSIIDSTRGLIQKRFDDSGIDIVFENNLSDDCVIIGSSDRIKQVFLNLLINAKDAMPDGGELKITSNKRDNEIEVSFSDTGKGIPPNDIPVIFEPFYTTKRQSGTGLGLSVCYGIIRSHGGDISAANNPEGGATFKIRFPIKDSRR